MFILVFIYLLLATDYPVFGQPQTQDIHTDFSYQIDLYNQNYNQYLDKKQVHLQYHSLATEKELIDQIKTCLLQRNSLISSYISLIINKSDLYRQSDTTGDTNQISNTLSQHQAWLQLQPQVIDAIANNTGLEEYNKVFITKYSQIKFDIGLLRSQYHTNHQNTIYYQIIHFLDNIDTSLDQDSWISDIKGQLEQSRQILSQAKQLSSKQTSSSYNLSSDYFSEAKSYFDLSRQNLNQVISNIESYLKKFY